MTHPVRTQTAQNDRLDAIRPWLAPGLALVGLLIVAFVTLSLMNGSLPFVGGSNGSGNGPGTGDGNGGGGAVPPPAAPEHLVVRAPKHDPRPRGHPHDRQHLVPRREKARPPTRG